MLVLISLAKHEIPLKPYTNVLDDILFESLLFFNFDTFWPLFRLRYSIQVFYGGRNGSDCATYNVQNKSAADNAACSGNLEFACATNGDLDMEFEQATLEVVKSTLHLFHVYSVLKSEFDAFMVLDIYSQMSNVKWQVDLDMSMAEITATTTTLLPAVWPSCRDGYDFIKWRCYKKMPRVMAMTPIKLWQIIIFW